jgi:hypothetical protein
MDERGEEELDGHPCVKRLAVINVRSGGTREVLCWFARDLKYFPVQIQFKEGNQLETIAYRNVQFARPARSLFEPPRDFTLCHDIRELMGLPEDGAGGLNNY